jgi:hypothetical protein
MTPAQRFSLAPSAILVRYNLESPLLLGGREPGEQASGEARELLEDSWEIKSRADAAGALKFLAEEGHRAEYDSVRLSPKISKKRARFVQQHDVELGGRSLLAWDLGRVSFVAGKSFLAGFLDEAQAWKACLEAARRLQKAYRSFEELGRQYLLGREFWNDNADEAMGHVYRALVLEKEGPWSLPWDTDLG